MSWLYETRQFLSPQNGLVHCRRLFGRWDMRVQGTSQVCSALDDVWRIALNRHIPRAASIKRILILGLANGSTLPLYRKRFPGCHITAIEWDASMVDFMDATQHFGKHERPDVLIGDAAELIQHVPGRFDLICIDLFTGESPSPLLQQPSFQKAIAEHLEPYGYILINTFRTPFSLEGWKDRFRLIEEWHTYSNQMHALRLYGAGTIGDPLPQGYERFQANQEYLKREFSDWHSYRLIPSGKNLGLRMPVGPICFEFYRGDHEPDLSADEDRRLVFWYPTSRIDKSRHWWRLPVQLDRGKTGFTLVEAGEAYWQSWSSQARRHRNAWYRQDRYRITTPTLDTYIEAYSGCSLNPGLVRGFSQSLRHKAKVHGERLHLFGVHDTETGRLVAGLATLELRDISQSLHVTSFILDEARSSPAGTALIDAWFADGQSRGFRFFEFDGFWAPGDPKNWKKYSAFKQQFHTSFIIYPKPLIRWMPKRAAS